MTRALFNCLIFLLLPGFILAQAGSWVWVNGSSALNTSAVYGTQGVPDIHNNPLALYAPGSWVDKQGNFWLFSGEGGAGVSNDLWKYEPDSNTWTWVKGPGVATNGVPPVFGTIGIPSISNSPGARELGIITWADTANNLWLFGGDNWAGIHGDMWRYNITTNEWTWMSGGSQADTPVYGIKGIATANNNPGVRIECAASWVDKNGNFWFFGGQDQSSGYNDLWKYDVTINQWAWMSGPQGSGQPGSYGTMGVADSTNIPPNRFAYAHWQDTSGNFYLYGGIGYSDVWKYDPLNNIWTWVAGENSYFNTGHYTGYCQNSGSTGPPGRTENRTAQTAPGAASSAFLVFGGLTGLGYLNDLWLLDNHSYQWTWLNGPDTINSTGSYGTMGIAAITNMPPARAGHVLWQDKHGDLWIFGGIGRHGLYSDLWKYISDEVTAYPQQSTICSGDSVSISVGNGYNLQVTPSGSVHIIDSANVVFYPATSSVYQLTANAKCSWKVDTFNITINVKPIAGFQLSDTAICGGDSAKIQLQGLTSPYISPSASVNWQDSVTAWLTPDSSTIYTVSGIGCGGSNYQQQVTINIDSPSVIGSIRSPVVCSGVTTQICATPGFSSYLWSDGQTLGCIQVGDSGSYQVTVSDGNGCKAVSNLVWLTTVAEPLITITAYHDTLVANADTSLQWYLNGNIIPGATNSFFVITGNGSYTVKYLSPYCGLIVSNAIVINPTDIGPIPDDKIEIFPNPSQGSWTLKVNDNLLQGLAEVFDADGSLVYSSVIHKLVSGISLSTAGIYLLRVSSAKTVLVKKLVKIP